MLIRLSWFPQHGFACVSGELDAVKAVRPVWKEKPIRTNIDSFLKCILFPC
jgi:hypothetical protein